MADRKPIRWFVPQGGESFMGVAAYYLTHEENMRKSFSQPSRSVRRTLPDGTTIDYIMNDVVDCIRILPPQRIVRAMGKAMTWDKLPPLEEGTENIDLSQMTADPDVTGGYYCTVSVINGTDANGRMLSATFSVKAGTDEDGVEYSGWSIEQGIRQIDGSYKVDGKSATLLLGASVEGDCEIIARDGKTELKKKVSVSPVLLSGICFRSNMLNFLSTISIENGILTPVAFSGAYIDIASEFYLDDPEHYRYVYAYDANNTMTQHSYAVGGFGEETTYYDGLSGGVPFSFYSVIANVYTDEGTAIRTLPASKICMIEAV